VLGVAALGLIGTTAHAAALLRESFTTVTPGSEGLATTRILLARGRIRVVASTLEPGVVGDEGSETLLNQL